MRIRLAVSTLATLLLLAGAAASGYEAKPLTLTEGRVAVGWIQAGNVEGIVGLTMGERTVGVPPDTEVQPVREVCLLVVDNLQRLLDQACTASDVFVDDLFTTGYAADDVPSVVIDEFGREIAHSRITFDGRWSRDALDCRPVDEDETPFDMPVAYRSQAGAPVFPYAFAEVRTQCTAATTLTMRSEYLGDVAGQPAGLLGLYAGESWFLPQQDYPIAAGS